MSGSGRSFVSGGWGGGTHFEFILDNCPFAPRQLWRLSSSFIRTRPLCLLLSVQPISFRFIELLNFKFQVSRKMQGRFCVLFSGPLTSCGGAIGRLKYSARNGRNLAKYSEHFRPSHWIMQMRQRCRPPKSDSVDFVGFQSGHVTAT